MHQVDPGRTKLTFSIRDRCSVSVSQRSLRLAPCSTFDHGVIGRHRFPSDRPVTLGKFSLRNTEAPTGCLAGRGGGLRNATHKLIGAGREEISAPVPAPALG
ncbi:hypothetical protein AAFF_G00368320 [Aldrovandia affinis]|uniref:Uncharacterized protein n=1 Tax=Aldrovandia affinis TaxID=143900 RepID=A0AAD7WMM6_9TELE|nr:hypothetical protein AAFF_G00368320 [Aldrovandia affinis]